MRGKAAVILAVTLVLLALGYSFCHALASYDHNENMYVTAGVRISQGESIYRDFAYLQMPYLPELYALIYRTTGTTHHLLAARIANWLIWVLGAGLLGWTAWHISGNGFFSVGLLLLYLLNVSMLRITIESSNYALPATLALAQVALVLTAMRAQGKLGRMTCLFLAGVAAGLSVGTKLNFLAAVGPFFLLPLFFRDREGRRCWICRLLAMGAGFALALAPAALLLARDPWVFTFDNLRFHLLVTKQDLTAHVTGAMTLAGKLSWIKHHYFAEVAAAILLGIAGIALTSVRGWRDAIARDSVALAAVVACGLNCTLLATLWMTPIWPQYFAMPVPYLLLLAACVYSLRPQWRVAWSGAVWVCVALAAATVVKKDDLDSLRNVHRKWTPLAIEHSAAQIRRQMQSAGLNGKVATLQPLFATEADLPTYREFATGPFLYGVGHMLSANEQKRVIGTSPASLAKLLDSDPPAAILVGLYSGWDTERAFEDYALKHGYQPVRLESLDFPALDVDPKSANKPVAPIFGESKIPKKKDYAILYLRSR
jgi:hypothetical protein